MKALLQEKPTISFEIFPPKKQSGLSGVMQALDRMQTLRPDFISITYGAGGTGNSCRTVELAHEVLVRGITPLAHLTCVGASRSQIREALLDCKSLGIQNILALRGDLPPEGEGAPGDFHYAEDLIRYIRTVENFTIGAACYPEGHIAAPSQEESDTYLLRKQEAGADFFISQLFFQNAVFLRFRERMVKRGIRVPIIAGVMPILGKSQIQRMIFTCGASLPAEIVRILYRYENDPPSLILAGMEYAARQVEGLLREGVDGVHIYSMNKPEIAASCKQVYDRFVSGGQNPPKTQ